MTPERWHQIEQIFEAALELPAQERDPFVRARAADEPMVQEVLHMLAESGDAGDTLYRAVTEAAAGLEPTVSKVGNYRLVRLLGHGGMGSVHLAERGDAQYQQKVAVKLISRALVRPELIARFRRERQILATLNHPNVARLIDGGTTEEGLPYLVMEYVDGQPLLDYCRDRKLGAVARLRLFQQVCSAVEYAHRYLIVHRDLKPDNILVDSSGAVKLLDFGIAKLMEEDDSGATRTGLQALTPSYASPEQVRGENVTTASDVYSLGVVLFELLTGQLPYPGGRRSTAAEMMRAVCEDPAIVPHTLAKELAGDLDSIILMALRKEPARRYGSVAEFSADVERHLDGLPVKARPDTFRYRAAKFLRRNRIAAMAAAVTIASVLGFSVWALRERTVARAEQKKAERVAALLVDVFNMPDPTQSKGEKISARDILARARERLKTQLKDEPEMHGVLLAKLGGVYTNLRDYVTAEAVLKDAVALLRAQPVVNRAELADALSDLSITAAYLGRLPESIEIGKEAYAALPPGKPTELHIRVLHNQSGHLRLKGDRVAARKKLDEAMAIADRILAPGDPTRLHLMQSNATLEMDFRKAAPLYRELIAAQRRTLADPHPEIIDALNNLGWALINAGDLDGAEASVREAIAQSQKLYGPDNESQADALRYLAQIQFARRDYAKSVESSREAVRIGRQRFPPNDTLSLGPAILGLARASCWAGGGRGGEREFEEAFRALRAAFPPGHFRIAAAEAAQAECQVLAGRYAEAERILVTNCEIMKKARHASDRRIGECFATLARLYEATGRPNEAARARSGGL
ncbi:MAG: protein kinase [Bryobacteraceae bacterium]